MGVGSGSSNFGPAAVNITSAAYLNAGTDSIVKPCGPASSSSRKWMGVDIRSKGTVWGILFYMPTQRVYVFHQLQIDTSRWILKDLYCWHITVELKRDSSGAK